MNCKPAAMILLTLAASAETASDPLTPWRSGVTVRPVSTTAGRHTIHTYFNVSPESPDGKWVLLFASTETAGESGSVVIRNRATGEERVLARNVSTEDAHRVACQQWISKGKRVVFHDFRNGVPVVVAVDIDTLKRRDLARGWLVGWGQPDSDLVPIYPPHWKNSSGETDLKLLNVATGEMPTVVTAKDTLAAYPAEIRKIFGERPVTLFFPILSPNLQRIFFKLASAQGDGYKSPKASFREMLIAYDREKSRFLFVRDHWGHPFWSADSRRVLNVRNVIDDVETGAAQPIPGLPAFPGQHLGFSPDDRLFATDLQLRGAFEGPKGHWGVAVADTRGGQFVVLHKFDNSRGASTWRVSHPHPAFSPDGRRIYFNVSSGQWTQLHVAEAH